MVLPCFTHTLPARSWIHGRYIEIGPSCWRVVPGCVVPWPASYNPDIDNYIAVMFRDTYIYIYIYICTDICAYISMITGFLVPQIWQQSVLTHDHTQYIYIYIPGWWFGTSFFPHIGNNHPS